MPRSVSSSRPVGQIIAANVLSTTPPQGTLYLDGSTVLKASYPALYAALAGQVAETGTTFTLPDLRGEFLRGLDTTAATKDPDKATRTGGLASGLNQKLGSTQGHAYASHAHNTIASSADINVEPYNTALKFNFAGNTWSNDASTSTRAIGIATAGGSETRGRNFATNYFIVY